MGWGEGKEALPASFYERRPPVKIEGGDRAGSNDLTYSVFRSSYGGFILYCVVRSFAAPIFGIVLVANAGPTELSPTEQHVAQEAADE